MKKILIFLFTMTLLTELISSCKKVLNIGTPSNQLVTKSVFTDSTSAKAALLNIYALYSNTIDGSYNSSLALYADELNFSSVTVQTLEFAHSAVSTANSNNLTIWKNYYFIIYSCNDIINQLSATEKLPATLIKQYSSEAKFLRAFAYFELTNTYGNVPLVLTTDVTVNATVANADSSTIYNQIIKDLTDAENTLSATYPASDRVRVNSIAASALLARVYLYQKQWASAETYASKVINSGLYTPLTQLSNVFSANSNESILQFQTQSGYIATTPLYVPTSGKPQYPVTNSLLSAFEPGDLRKSTWIKSTLVSGITYYYPYKYHNRTTNTSTPEYLTALRVSEQYLIRAEARAMQNNFSGAQTDLNIIRTRAGLANTTATSQSTLITAITKERQAELFTEWGHRFFDLKRLGQANSAIAAIKSTWITDTSLLLPIPQNEIVHDPNLKQNAGY